MSVLKRALLHSADIASLALAMPATFSSLACSVRAGGHGVGRHSSAFGCLAFATGSATIGEEFNSAAITITAVEAGLLVGFMCLQSGRMLLTFISKLLGKSAPGCLYLHAVATAFLLLATASVAVNNLATCLYSVAFALQFLALTAQLAGFFLTVSILITRATTSTVTEARTSECETDFFRPIEERSFQSPLILNSGQRLPFVDDDERLVYEFRGDGRLEWRIGSDRGGNGSPDLETIKGATQKD